MSKYEIYVKHCSRCKLLKFAEDYYKDDRANDGLRSSCRTCQNEMNKAWKAKNKDRVRVTRAQWLSRNLDFHRNKEQRRRARKRNAKTFRVTRKDTARLLNGPCFYCGSKGEITLDHIIPLIKGGDHSVGNLVGACKACNSHKQGRFVTQWRYGKTMP